MGVQLTGLGETAAVAADATFDSLHLTMRPMDFINWTSIVHKTGALTLAAAHTATGAGALFSLRNAGTNYIAVRKFALQGVTVTGFTTGMLLEYYLYMVRNMNTPHTGGTSYSNAVTNARLRSNMPYPAVNLNAATTATLTAPLSTVSSHVYDGNALAHTSYWSSTTTAGIILPYTVLFEALAGDFPIILKPNEGLVLSNVTLMSAAGVINLLMTCEFAELPSNLFVN